LYQSLLPKGFDYYAGGHVHIVKDTKVEGYGTIAYPGPLFPNSFSELEELERGGFYIIEDGNLRWEPIQIYNTYKIILNCNHKTPELIEQEINDKIKDNEFNDTIVLIRIYGSLENGKPTDINFKDIFQKLYDKSAYFVMKNTNALTTKDFEEIKIDTKSVEDVESNLIKEHLGQIKVDNLDTVKEEDLTRELMQILSQEKAEGMTKPDFENKIKDDAKKILELDID